MKKTGHTIIGQSIIAVVLAGCCGPIPRRGSAPATQPTAKIDPSADVRLSIVLDRVDFDDAKLGDALDYLASRAGLNIVPQWNRIQSVDKSSIVTLHLRQVRCSAALSAVLAVVSRNDEQLHWDTNDGIVFVATEEVFADKSLKTRTYDIGGLLSPDMTPREFWPLFNPGPTTGPSMVSMHVWSVDELQQLITNSIDLRSWQVNGGSFGLIYNWGDQMVITTTEENHCRIAELLGQLHRHR